MNDEKFIELLQRQVRLRSESSGLVDTLSFVLEVAERLGDDPVFGDFVPIEYIGTGKRGRNLRLHGYTEFDAADGSIGLVIADWDHECKGNTLNKVVIEKLLSNVTGFVEEVFKGDLISRLFEGNPAYDLAETLLRLQGKLSRIRVHVLTNRVLSSRYDTESAGDVCDIPIELHPWDLRRLRIMFESDKEREAVEIKLSDFDSIGIPALPASQSDEFRSMLCVVEANVLADMFERYGSRLLEGNVRSFLGVKVVVNKGIRKTIQSEPKRFFVYNNGIAATASNIEVDVSNGQMRIIRMKDFQIVNGGQTTSTLVRARKIDRLSLDGVCVQMKLTEVSGNNGSELVPKIAQFANTQTKVTDTDFFANHPFHRQIEEISRRLAPPPQPGERIPGKWFYERSRGQYVSQTTFLSESKAKEFNVEYPKSRLLTKIDLAKYDNLIKLKPHWVSLAGQKSFIKFSEQFEPSGRSEKSSGEYWDEISVKYRDGYFQDIVAMGVIYRAAEKLVTSAEWYESGYRIQIVSYGISLLLHLVQEAGYTFDFTKLWKSQNIDASLESALLFVTYSAKCVIQNPKNMATSNHGEWAKKEACWDQLKNHGCDSLDLSSLKGWLVSSGEHVARTKERKKAAEVDKDIDLQSQVFRLSEQGYWKAILVWPEVKHFVSPGTIHLLNQASTPVTCLRLQRPSDWSQLMDCSKRCEDEGFVFQPINPRR